MSTIHHCWHLQFGMWRWPTSSTDLSHEELICCVKEIKFYHIGNGTIKRFLKWIKISIFHLYYSGHYVEEEFKGDKTLDKEGS